MGALAERGRTAPVVLFSFVWITLVYCPLTHWVWAPGGWAFKWGVLDYAGGGPVEIASGVGGLAYTLVLGRRMEDQLINFRCVRVHPSSPIEEILHLLYIHYFILRFICFHLALLQ